MDFLKEALSGSNRFVLVGLARCLADDLRDIPLKVRSPLAAIVQR